MKLVFDQPLGSQEELMLAFLRGRRVRERRRHGGATLSGGGEGW